MIAGQRVEQLAEGMHRLCQVLASLGRLRTLLLLDEASIQARLEIARAVTHTFDLAVELGAFLDRYAGLKLGPVAWEPHSHPEQSEILIRGTVDRERLSGEIDRHLGVASALVAELREKACDIPLLAAWIDAIDRAAAFLPAPTRGHVKEAFPTTPKSPGWRKTVAGPRSVPTDASFRKDYGLLERDVPKFGETFAETVPYLWVLATRESLAAELCALCIVEWDGLPLSFYLDFSKQMWDECRHADFCRHAAVSLIEDLERELEPTDALLADVVAHREQAIGLPIPREGNLYEAISNASLIERIILMHHDTETPGITELQRQAESPLWAKHPEIAEGLSIVELDERSHARLGHRWLRYLVPNANERENAIDEARLLRPILILTSVAEHGPQELRDLIRETAESVARSAL
jgi:hypothetical protein